MAPLSPAWRGARGPLWAQAADLRRLADAWRRLDLVVDSIVVACGGADPTDPGTPARYAAGLQQIGLPALSLAHVTKEGGLAYPFGSVFWHNLARATWSLELDGAGASSVLAARKDSEHERGGRFVVEVTYREGLPAEVWERPYSAVLAERVAEVLEDGPATVPAIVERLNDAAEDGAPRQGRQRAPRPPSRPGRAALRRRGQGQGADVGAPVIADALSRTLSRAASRAASARVPHPVPRPSRSFADPSRILSRSCPVGIRAGAGQTRGVYRTPVVPLGAAS